MRHSPPVPGVAFFEASCIQGCRKAHLQRSCDCRVSKRGHQTRPPCLFTVLLVTRSQFISLVVSEGNLKSGALMNLSAQELIDFYENAPCGFHALDSAAGFIHMNQTELHWLGYCYDEVVGRMKLTDILTIESRHSFEQRFKRFKAIGSVHDLEMDFIRKDGTIQPVLVSATAVRDSEERYVMSRSVVYNLTDRLRAHVWFRAILDAAPDPMIVISRTGDILLANRQAEKLFGYRGDQMRGRQVEMLVPEHLRVIHANHRANFFASPHARPMGSGYELRGLRKDGTEVPIEVSLSPMEFDRMLVAVAAIRDLTERHAIEEKARRSQAQYKLLFENSMDGILLTLPDGTIVEANPSACRILGRTRQTVLKAGREGILDTSDPAVARFIEERTRTGKAMGELRAFRGNGTLFQRSNRKFHRSSSKTPTAGSVPALSFET
jgi:PAS domain S-box-containing protein